jgi:Tol biopolymer transport system component
MNADGSNVVELTSGPADDRNARWSSDGSKIIFASNRAGGDWDLFIMDANGTNITPLFDTTGSEWGPAPSPDGTRIAFSAEVDGNVDIYVMNAPSLP